MKKLFALLAVASLAAVGCNDNKTTGKPSNATTGGTFVKTDTVRHDVTVPLTNTVIHNTAVETNTKTVEKTVTKPGGPGLPDGKGKGGDGK